jgi:MYXO-CTERM domain-containing protein
MTRAPFAVVAGLALASCTFETLPTESDELEVIGGEPTPDGQYPATGALLVGGQPSCSGTLIAPDVVITAAHCVDNLLTGGQIPSFTLARDANTATAGEIVAGESAIGHPQFDLMSNPGTGVGQWFDIGLVVLAEDITTVDYEIMPDPTEATAGMAEGMDVELVGYGLTSVDSFEVGVKHHGLADLVEVGSHELFIAEPGQQQNCNGDSGGPAYVDIDGNRRIVGVVSRAPDQNPTCDHGGIDTRIDPYLEWIHQQVTLPCGTGLSDPCPEPDAGPDAGPGGGPDGGPGADTDGGGCGCATTGGAPGSNALVALLVAGALLRRRRRS